MPYTERKISLDLTNFVPNPNKLFHRYSPNKVWVFEIKHFDINIGDSFCATIAKKKSGLTNPLI